MEGLVFIVVVIGVRLRGSLLGGLCCGLDGLGVGCCWVLFSPAF